MAVTWNVVSLDATKTVGSLSDVVTTVHWTASDSFTAYKDITKDNAITWAKAAIGSDEVTAIETRIAAQISESKAPTVSSGTPW